MRGAAILLVLCVLTGGVSQAQSGIGSDSDIETDGQFVSNATTGTPPLVVSSTTTVANLDADTVDGFEGSGLDSRLTSAETMLVALQSQLDALGMARLRRTGQTSCYDNAGTVVACGTGIGLGQDGDVQLGVVWPNPRFTDNGDGTVTDNLTGLIWLAAASCGAGVMTWQAALDFANTLFDGSVAHGGGDCGLSDGSGVGAWRVPNVLEMMSLANFGFADPIIPDTAGTGHCDGGTPCPFSAPLSELFWTSTSDNNGADYAYYWSGTDARLSSDPKTAQRHVWTVRGGQ